MPVSPTFEVMTGGCPYCPARTVPEAIAELKRGAGAQFDPELVGLFTPRLKEEDGIKTGG